ncbi:MAG: rhomboid family intramembrane serine protease [Myxococcota bacterium]|nr:rhomboid family intramembrane serine protease [Myxococcota bacterium]MDW8361453.1 rhomboid family intramembrane serine protease [Myxococcales bacterium]
MIPLKDTNPTLRAPIVTRSLVAMNIAVYAFQASIAATDGPGALAAMLRRFGVVAAELLHVPDFEEVTTLFTSMFLHADLLHLGSNMLFLWVFGDNVEDILGRGRYVFFYVVGGLVAALAQVVVDPSSRVPLVGASGAISAVLAGYVVMHPRAPVLAWIPPLFFQQLPAFVFLILWFLLQLLYAFLSLPTLGAQQGGVAFFAHVGGFVAGLLLARPIAGTRLRQWDIEAARLRRRSGLD